MQIYNVEPMQALVNMTKGLFSEIPIYKESMHEEANDVPNSYILLRSQITDTTESYGDGKNVVRSADCDIMLISKGYADDTDDLHNINKRKIREHLKAQEINFDEVNLGYNDGLKSTQHTFSVEVKYV